MTYPPAPCSDCSDQWTQFQSASCFIHLHTNQQEEIVPLSMFIFPVLLPDSCYLMHTACVSDICPLVLPGIRRTLVYLRRQRQPKKLKKTSNLNLHKRTILPVFPQIAAQRWLLFTRDTFMERLQCNEGRLLSSSR